MFGVFVAGEPVLSGGKGQAEWQESIQQSVAGQPTHPSLTFVVGSLRRRGHPFDLDNLVHPVLMVFEDPIDTVSARLVVGERAGLVIEDSPPAPPPSETLRTIYLATHSDVSDRNRVGIPEIADDPVFDDHEGVGLSLIFDRSDIPIRQGWFGPTEAVVDDLVSWLGTYTKRELIADHRVRDLRITRGVNPSKTGVSISLWYVPDSDVESGRSLTTSPQSR